MAASSTPETPQMRDVLPSWKMVFPPGWASVPTDPERAPAAIRHVLDQMLTGRARDELIQVRVDLDRRLRDLAAAARENGASHFHFLAEPIRGVPVSGSLSVSSTDGAVDSELGEVLATVFGESNGVIELGRVTVGEYGALRRRRRIVEPTSEPDLNNVHHCLDYIVDSGDGNLLLLAFNTDTDAVADEMVGVFDMMAATLIREEA